MVKTVEVMATYHISLHDLADKLGIWAERIVEVNLLKSDAEWDEPAIEITVITKRDEDEEP